MTHPVFKLVAVCLLLLALVTPRPADRTLPPIITPATSATTARDWNEALSRTLDEEAYRLAVWYAAAAATTSTTTRVRSAGSAGDYAGSGECVPAGGPHRGYPTAKLCASCVEHGGSYSESSNLTHKGRYQFARRTWIAFGGPAEHWDDWSLTSPAEQDAVFERAWSSPGGPSNWLPYDKC